VAPPPSSGHHAPDTPVRDLPEGPPASADAAGPREEVLTIIEPVCAAFRRRLKSEGLKYTPERARILDEVMAIEEPFDVEVLLARLRQRNAPTRSVVRGRGAAAGGVKVSKATVYRTLKLLLDAGVVQQVLVESEQAHYQVAWGHRPQALIVRTDTQQFAQAEVPELNALVERLCRERGLRPRGHRLVIYAESGSAG
jgi:Fur family ferric uptake transcriptional regulator